MELKPRNDTYKLGFFLAALVLVAMALLAFYDASRPLDVHIDCFGRCNIMDSELGCDYELIGNNLTFTLHNTEKKPITITRLSCTYDKNQYEACDSARCQGYDSDIGGVLILPNQTRRFYPQCYDDKGRQMLINEVDWNKTDFVGRRLNIRYLSDDLKEVKALVCIRPNKAS
jgi:hypothetical protein